MWSNAQNMVRQALLNGGLHVSSTTQEGRLADFFSAIKPVATNHPLVRVGGAADGGYLVPDDLAGIGACFSPGVADSSSFELDMADRGIPCFMADFSVDGPAAEHPLFRFDKKFLGPVDAGVHMRLATWVEKYVPGHSDLLLQMDIEGAEYGVIMDTPIEVLRRFRILAIEFHHLHALCDKFGFDLIHLSFMKLLQDFEVVHLHPNNCAAPVHLGRYAIPPVLEITLLRRDRISHRSPASLFPHPLDRSSYLTRGDFALPECWFR
ncbi:MAG TPA: FkbM family methyltransferase [Burkholderiales bacterium]|jgi:hypothetical protein